MTQPSHQKPHTAAAEGKKAPGKRQGIGAEGPQDQRREAVAAMQAECQSRNGLL